MKIERKFLVRELPKDIPFYEKATIYQYYLSTSPEVRLHKKVTDSYILNVLTIKENIETDNKTICSFNEEQIVTATFFRNVTEKINKKPIVKKLWKCVAPDGNTVSFYLIDDSWYCAEVEFSNEEAANKYTFSFPEVLISEITFGSFYKMRTYWENTR